MALPQLEGSVPGSEVLVDLYVGLPSHATKFGLINDQEHSSNLTRKIIFKLGCVVSEITKKRLF